MRRTFAAMGGFFGFAKNPQRLDCQKMREFSSIAVSHPCRQQAVLRPMAKPRLRISEFCCSVCPTITVRPEKCGRISSGANYLDQSDRPERRACQIVEAVMLPSSHPAHECSRERHKFRSVGQAVKPWVAPHGKILKTLGSE